MAKKSMRLITSTFTVMNLLRVKEKRTIFAVIQGLLA